jgi:chromosome segregation protein
LHINRQKAESIFTRSQALKTLEAEVEELKAKLAAFDEALKALQEERGALLAEVQKLDQEMRRADMQVVSSNFQLQALEKQQAQALQEYTRQESEMGSLSELVNKLRSDREAKEKEREPAQKALLELEKEFQECEKSARQIGSQVSLLAEQKQKTFFAYDEVLKRQEKEKHALELLQVRKKEQESRLEQELKLQKTIQTELALIERKKAELSVQLDQQIKALAVAEDTLAAKIALGATLEEEAKKLELEQSRIQSQKEETLKVSSSQKVELTHQQEQLASLEEALKVDLPEGYESFKPVSTVPAQIETEVTRTRNSLDRMRNVNLLAVEEYQQTHERHTLLQSQLQDLEEAEKELLQIVTDLERESRKAFNKTFEEVRVAFKKHFQTLFQGGEADLVLVNAESGQSGVEIMAKPPGKQMRSMQLLSGGEKSLTAVALLFACFEVRPSPFCILDEVDAPLDESNVERLGNLLKQFCERTQFLVITHNKKTMNIADALIGVSMAEKGVSQIISLDFKRRESENLAVNVAAH